MCWNCGVKGRVKKNCPNPKKKGGSNKKNSDYASSSVSLASDDDYGDVLVLSVDSPIETWILDSGASFHSSPCKEYFQNFKSGKFGKVFLADDNPLDIEGTGNIMIRTSSGSSWELEDVRYIPGQRKNLISVGQLDSSNYRVMFGDGTWNVSRGAMVVARGSKTGTLYTTLGCTNMVATAAICDTKLWHSRLGHMSEKGMKLLASKGKLSGLKSVDMEFCETCVFGKQKKVSFTKTLRSLKKEKLEFVHTNVWGPYPTQSLGGSHYFVTFIDDSTRKVWVYFMKHKSEVNQKFKIWKAEVENASGQKIKRIKSDNGGESELQAYKDICEQDGIVSERTVPGKPRQNGVAEWMNRTLLEQARCLRLSAGLPKCFWVDVVSTAAYLVNRSPSVPLEFKIPEEKWSGKEITYSHLKIFGCVAYLQSEKRDKLDPKAIKCYFIGYGDEKYGYRLWDAKNRKVIRHCDVTFDEGSLYKDNFGGKSVERETFENDTELVELDGEHVRTGEPLQEEELEVPIQQPSPQASVHSQGDCSLSDSDEKSHPNLEDDVEVHDEPPGTPIIRRSSRSVGAPDKYSPSAYYLLLTDSGEPECYMEAMRLDDSKKWEQAMSDEMSSLDQNDTWVLVDLPKGKRALLCKWIFRKKDESDGQVRYKARLVVKGFSQKEGIDFHEIFAPVVKLTTIRILLGIVASEGLFLEQMDVKTALLHGDLDEEIYMRQPEGFQVPGKEDSVCKLKRSLYGLKQAPRQWYKKFDSFMISGGFVRTDGYHCCYFQRYVEGYIYLVFSIDDMLIAGNTMKLVNGLKKKLSMRFEMKDLGEAKQILGMRISRDLSTGLLRLSQEEYVKKVLKRFNMDNAKPRLSPLSLDVKLTKEDSPKTKEDKERMATSLYASAVGSVMYAMVCTRPDIAHAVGVVSRFMSNPGERHWEAVKWLLRYLIGTSGMALCYGRNEVVLEGFVDADFGGCQDSSKSTSGYVFTIGGTTISWMSKLQKCISMSTTEAEYIAMSEAGKEIEWLKGFLEEMGMKQDGCVLHSDSQSAVQLAKNPMFHYRTKHIKRRYHYTRSLVEDGSLRLVKIVGSKNPADMLTKVVSSEKLGLCRTSIGLRH